MQSFLLLPRTLALLSIPSSNNNLPNIPPHRCLSSPANNLPQFPMNSQQAPLADFNQNLASSEMSFTNSSPQQAQQAPSAEPSPHVQPMHQGTLAQAQGGATTTLEMQRQLLQQKLAEKSSGTFTSPTDQMMTPCSKKLQNHKTKSFRMQPKLLSKSFGLSKASQQQQQPEKEKSSSLNPFDPSN